MSTSMPTCYMLIGLPGTGKSTWIRHFYEEEQNQVIISSDYFIERFARLCGMTYNEAFPLAMARGIPDKFIRKRIKRAIAEGRDVLWDQTNLTVKSRKAKMAQLPGYQFEALVFETPPEELWKKNLDRPGKVIPSRILLQMERSYQAPTKDEGFIRIYY